MHSGVLTLGGWSMPGVSMTIMLGQYLYSMRTLISLASKHRDGSLSSLLFSDSIYAYEERYNMMRCDVRMLCILGISILAHWLIS